MIFNPAAQGGKAQRWVRQLETLGGECALRPTPAAGMARPLAAAAVQEGFDVIVAAGGDGTIHEVLNGIAEAPDGLARVCLGVIPVGTANAFAREHGLPRDLRRAWAVVCAGMEARLDVLQVEYRADGRPRWRVAAQLGGAGVDARAVELVEWRSKQRWGWASYVLAGLRALAHKPPPVTVRGGDQVMSGEQVLIGNGRLYAGPFVVFPAASPSDGRLDVCVVPRVRWTTVLGCCWGVATNRLSRVGRARHFQAEAISLTAPGRVPLELDGEVVGELPATCRVLPGALRLLVPP